MYYVQRNFLFKIQIHIKWFFIISSGSSIVALSNSPTLEYSCNWVAHKYTRTENIVRLEKLGFEFEDVYK